MCAHKLWVSNPPLCASAYVNGPVDHITHQTRCQSKLMTKPFIPFFFEESLKLVAEQKPSCALHSKALGNFTLQPVCSTVSFQPSACYRSGGSLESACGPL